MAGKKKKNLATKLAKMSDEERARYLQHRAEIEEEARRRKEQLIATFMKKKIKREEAFGRLNVAKINQNWHQILRKAKCKEMKEDVEHMKKWIERVINYKNKTISKLMEELEQAEEQYLNNFQSHSKHIDKIIEHQHQYIEKLKSEYERDLNDLITAMDKEKQDILKNAIEEEKHVQMILYGQERITTTKDRKEYEAYKQKCFEAECEYLSVLRRLRRSRRATCGAIWRQLSSVISTYLSKTEERRARVAELRADDEQSALLLRQYQARITTEEALKERLKQELANLQSERSAKISGLENELKAMNDHYIKVKQTLKDDLRNDKLKLEFLTDTSYKTISYLESLLAKGETLLMLGQKCQKFITEREKILKWLPVRDSFSSDSQADKESEEVKEKFEGVKEGRSLKSPSTELQQHLPKSKPRPKTAISISTLETPTPEIKDVTTVDQVTLQMKNLEVSLPSTSSSSSFGPKKQPSILDKCVESLKNLEHFWEEYGKVEVEVMEIQEEKKLLVKENKQLKEMLKAILEATAVVNTIPNNKTSTRLPRIAYSAPMRTTVF